VNNPLLHATNRALGMIENAIQRDAAKVPALAPAKDCTCAECGVLFALPALGVCPKCGSRQVRRANPREERGDALARALWYLAKRLRVQAAHVPDEVTATELRAIAQAAEDALEGRIE
jgi:hypothetical protein